MNRHRSLEDRLGRFFAGTLVALYSMVAIGVWSSSRQNGRQFATLALKTEAESVASYVAASGRLDASELAEMEREPFPIWMRITDGSRVLAETPGSPDPPRRAPKSTEEVKYWRPAPGADSLLVLRHAVGGPVTGLGDEVTVVAIADIGSVRLLERRLGVGLVLLAALMIPLATWIGRLVARRALAPLTGLVAEIRGLSESDTSERLTVPPGSVIEVAHLSESFNDVLDRLDSNLETMRRSTEDTSHENRNPPAVLRTGLEVHLRHERTGDEYRALLTENLDEIRRLQSTLDGLLWLARSGPDRNGLLQREAVDLARAASETAARFDAVAAERHAAIEVRSPGRLDFDCDPRLVRLILFNLLDNALKHGPEGRPVVLEVSPDGDGVLLAVTTEGAPIPPQQRDRLFERYDRPSARARGGVGGLGLSVIRWAAEEHGGVTRYVAEAGRNRFEATLRPAAAESASAATA
ncbi:MAG: ATP-binding protein [Thermoanaerobaculia bacterium]